MVAPTTPIRPERSSARTTTTETSNLKLSNGWPQTRGVNNYMVRAMGLIRFSTLNGTTLVPSNTAWTRGSNHWTAYESSQRQKVDETGYSPSSGLSDWPRATWAYPTQEFVASSSINGADSAIMSPASVFQEHTSAYDGLDHRPTVPQLSRTATPPTTTGRKRRNCEDTNVVMYSRYRYCPLALNGDLVSECPIPL